MSSGNRGIGGVVINVGISSGEAGVVNGLGEGTGRVVNMRFESGAS